MVGGRWEKGGAYSVIGDELEVDSDFTEAQIGMGCAFVNEFGHLFQADLSGFFAEHKQQRIDHVRLTRTVRTHNRSEVL